MKRDSPRITTSISYIFHLNRIVVEVINTLSMVLPSTKTTLDPQNSLTFGFTATRPEMIRAGKSSFTTGICAKKLTTVLQELC